MSDAVNVVRLDPGGVVETYTGADPLTLARAHFDGLADVINCRNPWITRSTVGIVDDFGLSKGLAFNPRAWLLYGRSPIFGPMYYSFDLPYPPLPPDFVAMLGDPHWHLDTFREHRQLLDPALRGIEL